MSAVLDWVIVGGGLHGGFLARALRRSTGRSPVVIDPGDDPLAAWRFRAEACGMDFLRSPRAHHLGGPGDDLRDFARTRGYGDRHFLGRYRRPSRAVFEAHARAALAPDGVPRVRDRIRHLERCPVGWRLHGETDSWRARRVLLAPGPPPPRRPRWAAGIPHLFDATSPSLPAHGEIAVIGGGISAAQAALAFAGDGRRVTLISRHPLRHTAFDSDPCYAGPRCMRPFTAIRDPRRRRRLIRAARQPGSLPPEIHARLGAVLAEGRVRLIRDRVADCGDAGPRLSNGRRLTVDAVCLATGFADTPPGFDWLRPAIERDGLPLAPCGFPAVTDDLQWDTDLYVAGRLAELALGPAAGNIRGARIAAERLRWVAAPDRRPDIVQASTGGASRI